MIIISGIAYFIGEMRTSSKKRKILNRIFPVVSRTISVQVRMGPKANLISNERAADKNAEI